MTQPPPVSEMDKMKAFIESIVALKDERDQDLYYAKEGKAIEQIILNYDTALADIPFKAQVLLDEINNVLAN